MSDVIARAILEIGTDQKEVKATLKEIQEQLRATAKETEGIGKNLNLMVFKEFATVAVKAIGSVAGEIIELGKRGAMVSDVSGSFDKLTQSTGSTSQAMLGALREGVVGTVSDFELMQLANKALGSGLITTTGDMKTLSEGARALAKRTGGDTKEAFETLTSAMASGRTAQLKQFGLFVDSKVAVEAYAASIGKSTGDLTDAERAQALSAGALAKLREELKKNVPDAADFGEMIDRAKTQISNFRDEVSVAVSQSPVLQAGMAAMGKAFESAFGENQAGAVSVVMSLINEFAILVARAGEIAVEVARFILNAWSGLNVGFNAIMMVIVGGLGLLASGVATVLELHAKIPGLGGVYGPIAAGARAAADDLAHLSTGFKAQADEALDGAARQNAAIDKVKGVITGVREAMEAARYKQVETTAAVETFGQKTAEVATRAVESTKKIAEAQRQLAVDINMVGRVGLDARIAQLDAARDKEILGIQELKGITVAEMTAMEAQVREKYRLMTEAARLSGDEIKNKTLTVQQEIALQTTFGLDNRLLQIEFARQKEIEGIQHLKLRYTEEYTAIEALINQKYAQQALLAQGLGMSLKQMATEAGFVQRDELQKTADKAVATYEFMKASGQYNADQLKEAHIKAEEAKRAAKGETVKYNMQSEEAILSGTQQVLGVLGEKNKGAAIAGALINTYLSVSKSLASAPWPANLALAAGALAAGMKSVSQIKSQKSGGFKKGTENLDFMKFGRVSMQPLHGEEAVIPRGRGHVLAGEIAAAMPSGGVGGGDEVQRILEFQERRLPRLIARALVEARQQS